MERLTQRQLDKVIAEVTQLSEQQQSEVEAEQVREILRELNLPPELLEEAMVQIYRRESIASQQRRHRFVIGSVVGLASLLLASALFVSQTRQHDLDQVVAQQDSLTLAQGNSLTDVSRQENNELFYRVTLSEAPVNRRLSLSCNWIDPNQQIVHQNSYQTKSIATTVWDTYCRYKPGTEAPIGTWQVEMFLGDRPIDNLSFEVK